MLRLRSARPFTDAPLLNGPPPKGVADWGQVVVAANVAALGEHHAGDFINQPRRVGALDAMAATGQRNGNRRRPDLCPAMNDPAIRTLLYPHLVGGGWIDELPTGSTRADVVHVTEHFMHGYEVKGDGDTLARAPNQLRCYAEVYDFVTFVVTARHLPKLLPLLPAWVGILVAAPDGLTSHRPARYNAAVQRPALAQLIWHAEVQQFLLARGLAGAGTLRRREVAAFLRTSHTVPLSALAAFVRARLLARLPERLLLREERAAESAARRARAARRPAHKRT